MSTSKKVATYYQKEHNFKEEIAVLRAIVLETSLEETFKWSFPTYTINEKNVLAICRFKGHFGIWFFNGIFLKDSLHILENVQEGKTLAMRHWKFSSKADIHYDDILTYVNEAIENEKEGLRLAPKPKTVTKLTSIPPQLKVVFKKDKALKSAFDQLTVYKQREYAGYISSAKQEKTKASRLQKIIPLILDLKGLNDSYR